MERSGWNGSDASSNGYSGPTKTTLRDATCIQWFTKGAARLDQLSAKLAELTGVSLF
jgi:hypothetical protein